MNLLAYLNSWCASCGTASDDSNGNMLFLRDFENKNVEDIIDLSALRDVYGDGIYAHTFLTDDMPSPYEPFLGSIQHFYRKYYADTMNVEEFVEACNVYFLQREVFSTYIQFGYAVRKEPVVISEVKFEHNKVLESILSCLEYIAREHKLLIILGMLQFAPLSTLEMADFVLKSGISNNIKILMLVNDNEVITNYRQFKMDDIVMHVEEQGIVFELEQIEHTREVTEYINFVPNSDRLKDYNAIFNNYYHFLALDDMEYYMDIVYAKIVGDNIQLGKNVAFNFYFYHALCNLLRGNDNRATIMCEHLTNYYDKQEDLEKDFQYNYINCKIHVSKSHNELAIKYANQCKEDAEKLRNEPFIFMAEVLYRSVQFGGWKNIFSVNFAQITSNDEFKLELNKYNFHNTLAYYLVYGFDNKEKDLEMIAKGETTDTYNEAFELINKIGNTELLLSAYTKYIILLTTHGFHNAVDRFYDYKLDVLIKENNVRRMANLYMGRGYANSINEHYQEAHKAFVEAVKILYSLNNAEQMAEAIYNMTINCFGAEDFNTAKTLMDLLFKILYNLGLKSIQVSSPAKLYALQAISYYKIGNDYRCFLGLKKIKKLVDIRTGNNNDVLYISNNPHEDLFLYYLIAGILDKHNGKIKSAIGNFEIAHNMYDKVAGFVFYALTTLVKEYYEALVMDGQEEKAAELIDKMIVECKKNNFNIKLKNIQAYISHKPIISDDFSDTFTNEEIENIITLSKNVGIEKQLNKQKKNIWFLSSWQEMLNHDYTNQKRMVSEAMEMFQDNFNFEIMIYIDIINDVAKTIYSNKDLPDDTNEKLSKEVMEFFLKSKKEFLANCIDNNFWVYENVFNPILDENTYSLIGIPVYNEKDIVSMYIGTINNQNYDITLLNDDDLSIMRTAVIQLHNATERIKSKADMVAINKKLNELAVTDLLTGLYNRQGMEKILNAHVSSKEKVSILYIDLDNFKYYNDNFGHDSGDMILKEFSSMFKRLSEGIGDAIRYGGDEFLIFLYGLGIEDARELAENIYRNIADALIPEIKKYVGEDVIIPKEKLISCSIGITQSSDSRISRVYAALKRADDALYNIKKSTKGNYCILNEDV